MSCEFFKGVRQLLLDCYQGLGWGAVPSDDVSGPGRNFGNIVGYHQLRLVVYPHVYPVIFRGFIEIPSGCWGSLPSTGRTFPFFRWGFSCVWPHWLFNFTERYVPNPSPPNKLMCVFFVVFSMETSVDMFPCPPRFRVCWYQATKPMGPVWGLRNQVCSCHQAACSKGCGQ